VSDKQYVVTDSQAYHSGVPYDFSRRWVVREEGTNNIHSRHVTRAEASAKRDELNTVNVSDSVEDYKQKVVLPAVDAAKVKHGLCDAGVEEFLKAVGITRPLPDLPTGKNALVECKSGPGGRSLTSLIFDGSRWRTVLNNYPWSTIDVQKEYVRTIFEGE